MTEEITAIGLASLHGTILSIIIGAFSVYAISLFLRLDEIIYSVLSEAEKANHINVAGSYGLTGAPEYVSKDDEVRKRLLSKLTKLVMGVPNPELPATANERGAELLRIISALSHYYPFPTRAQPTEQGGIAIGRPQPIEFHTIGDVQKWRTDLEEISRGISWLLDVHKVKFSELVEAFQRDQEERQFKMELPEDAKRFLSPCAIRDIEESMKKATLVQRSAGSYLVDGFIHMLHQANSISSAVGTKLEQYQVLKRRVPNKTWFFITIGFASIAFICAVILPMFCSVLPAFVWKGVPVAFYAYSLSLIVIKTTRL